MHDPDVVVASLEDPRAVTGGVQRRVSAEIEAYRDAGLHVLVLTTGSSDHRGAVRYATWRPRGLPYPAETLMFAVWAAALIRRYPNAGVVTHHDHGMAALVAGRPFLEVVHGVFLDEYRQLIKAEGALSSEGMRAAGLLVLAPVEALASRRADTVITVSQWAANRVHRLYGVRPGKIQVVTNGIDVRRFHPTVHTRHQQSSAGPALRALRIGFVGRLHARKAPMLLVRAFLELRTRIRSELSVVGTGPQLEALQNKVRESGASDRVTFLGSLPDSDLPGFYRSCDVVCVPSVQEGLGIVALEAQACGTPVIASDAGGLTEAVRHLQSGLIFKAGDATDLADAILRLALQPGLRLSLSRGAAAWGTAHAWQSVLRPQVELVEGLIGRQRSRRESWG